MNKVDIEILDLILGKINEWLKFAESKNAILAALSGSLIFGFEKLSNSLCLLQSNFGIAYFYNFMIFIVLSLITSLFSFVPQTKLFWLWKEKPLDGKPNILFFGDLARLHPKDLVKIIYNDSKCNELISDVRNDYAEQIIINSKIANRKYNFFRVALWFVIAAILTPFISGPLYLLIDPHSKFSVRQ